MNFDVALVPVPVQGNLLEFVIYSRNNVESVLDQPNVDQPTVQGNLLEFVIYSRNNVEVF